MRQIECAGPYGERKREVERGRETRREEEGKMKPKGDKQKDTAQIQCWMR